MHVPARHPEDLRVPAEHRRERSGVGLAEHERVDRGDGRTAHPLLPGGLGGVQVEVGQLGDEGHGIPGRNGTRRLKTIARLMHAGLHRTLSVLSARARWASVDMSPHLPLTAIALAAAAALASTAPAFAAVGPQGVRAGNNITVFHNIDMVIASGGVAGGQTQVDVFRGLHRVATTRGAAVGTDEGPVLEVNHGPEGAPLPGDCFDGATPNVQPGDRIVVSNPGGAAGVDEAIVDDIRLTAPAVQRVNPATGNTVVPGTQVIPDGDDNGIPGADDADDDGVPGPDPDTVVNVERDSVTDAIVTNARDEVWVDGTAHYVSAAGALTPIPLAALDSAEFLGPQDNQLRMGPNVVDARPAVAGGFRMRYWAPYSIDRNRNNPATRTSSTRCRTAAATGSATATPTCPAGRDARRGRRRAGRPGAGLRERPEARGLGGHDQHGDAERRGHGRRGARRSGADRRRLRCRHDDAANVALTTARPHDQGAEPDGTNPAAGLRRLVHEGRGRGPRPGRAQRPASWSAARGRRHQAVLHERSPGLASSLAGGTYTVRSAWRHRRERHHDLQPRAGPRAQPTRPRIEPCRSARTRSSCARGRHRRQRDRAGARVQHPPVPVQPARPSRAPGSGGGGAPRP